MHKQLPPEESDQTARRGNHFKNAFSLVEVILAIGITMFAGLVIFSLLPAGLSSLQDTGMQIVKTEIFRTIEAELSSTPYGELENHQKARFPIYFDNEGLEVSNASNAIFTVRCEIPTLESEGDLSRMVVKIGHLQDPEQAGSSKKISKRGFLIANKESMK